MSYQYALYEKREHIAYVTINRPDVMNALHPPASNELWQIWCDFRDDPELRAAILTAAGDKAFCAGSDLKYLASHVQEYVGKSSRRPGGFGGITNRFRCYKPIIAAVNGLAVGGGLEIALACDIIIAAEHSRFALPEVRIGGIAAAGGIHRLPRQIPLKIAMGMMLTGRQITAAEALRVGLVNEVVPLSELMTTAESWAKDIVRCAPLAVMGSKEAAYNGLDESLLTAINTSYYLQEVWRTSEDFIEGPRAFNEKRMPNWKGR